MAELQGHNGRPPSLVLDAPLQMPTSSNRLPIGAAAAVGGGGWGGGDVMDSEEPLRAVDPQTRVPRHRQSLCGCPEAGGRG